MSARLHRLAAVDFAPMSLPAPPAADQFRFEAGQVGVRVQQAVRLLRLTPDEMAALPDDLAAIFSNLSAAIAWLDGWRDVLACARGRVAVTIARNTV